MEALSMKLSQDSRKKRCALTGISASRVKYLALAMVTVSTKFPAMAPQLDHKSLTPLMASSRTSEGSRRQIYSANSASLHLHREGSRRNQRRTRKTRKIKKTKRIKELAVLVEVKESHRVTTMHQGMVLPLLVTEELEALLVVDTRCLPWLTTHLLPMHPPEDTPEMTTTHPLSLPLQDLHLRNMVFRVDMAMVAIKFQPVLLQVAPRTDLCHKYPQLPVSHLQEALEVLPLSHLVPEVLEACHPPFLVRPSRLQVVVTIRVMAVGTDLLLGHLHLVMSVMGLQQDLLQVDSVDLLVHSSQIPVEDILERDMVITSRIREVQVDGDWLMDGCIKDSCLLGVPLTFVSVPN